MVIIKIYVLHVHQINYNININMATILNNAWIHIIWFDIYICDRTISSIHIITITVDRDMSIRIIINWTKCDDIKVHSSL